MASERRRERRRASRKKSYVCKPDKRFRIPACEEHIDNEDKQNKYVWIHLYKGSIQVQGYNSSLKELAQEALLMKDPKGVYWAALRLCYPDKTIYNTVQKKVGPINLSVDTRDVEWLSKGARSFVNTLNGVRHRRAIIANACRAREMVPMSHSTPAMRYRMTLTLARNQYRIERKYGAALDAMLRRGRITEEETFYTSDEFITPCVGTWFYDESVRYSWDY